jgi:hypothetical protein
VLSRNYLTRQASMLLKFAKATTDPTIAAALVEKAADLKSQVDDSSVPNPTPLAPDVEPSAKYPTKHTRPQCGGGAVRPFEDAAGGGLQHGRIKVVKYVQIRVVPRKPSGPGAVPVCFKALLGWRPIYVSQPDDCWVPAWG